MIGFDRAPTPSHLSNTSGPDNRLKVLRTFGILEGFNSDESVEVIVLPSFVTSSVLLLLVVWPGAPSNVLVPNSDALCC